MRCCIALKARAAWATSAGPSSAIRRGVRSGPRSSAAVASAFSGRVTSRTAIQVQKVNTTNCATSTQVTHSGMGMSTRRACTVTAVPSPRRTSS